MLSTVLIALSILVVAVDVMIAYACCAISGQCSRLEEERDLQRAILNQQNLRPDT